MHRYRIFGLMVESELELDALIPFNDYNFEIEPIKVTFGSAEQPFDENPVTEFVDCKFNNREFYFCVPDVVRFRVTDGCKIIIEPLCEDWGKMLLFFYSNAIAAVLLQRGLIPFHVSGVLDASGRAWLLAAPSKTGKSTTALMLKERGFELFTDDTALLEIIDKKPMAVASYPMVRVWSQTLEKQQVFDDSLAYQMRAGIDKYGIHFHETFKHEPVEIAGIMFLNDKTDKLRIEQVSSINAFKFLRENVYRSNWVTQMGLETKIYATISGILSKVPTYVAYRPQNQLSFDVYADLIAGMINKDSKNDSVSN